LIDLFDAYHRFRRMLVFNNEINGVANREAIEQSFVLDVKLHDHPGHQADDLFVIELDRADLCVYLSHFTLSVVVSVFWGRTGRNRRGGCRCRRSDRWRNGIDRHGAAAAAKTKRQNNGDK